MTLYIGLMSGTSVDCIDAALVDLQGKPKLIATHNHDFPEALRKAIFSLFHPGENGVNRLGQTDTQIGELFAEAVECLLKKTSVNRKDIMAIGSHGQTVRHHPNYDTPFTLQIGDPNIIATRTGITTVADFRRKDVANGGEGAPFTPIFHNLLREENTPCIMLNIGGIANISYLPPKTDKNIIGFDTGPGNALSDSWCAKHLGKIHDENGQWASTGKINKNLLALCLQDPYFDAPHPKSTGKEYFNLFWIKQHLQMLDEDISPEDVQATLIEVSAQSITDAINRVSKSKVDILVCGGGAHNGYLMQRLAKLMHPRTVQSTAVINIDPNWVEAMAFAWFSKQTLHRHQLDMTRITGAKHPAVLGGVYYP